jgi:hypothetical protein
MQFQLITSQKMPVGVDHWELAKDLDGRVLLILKSLGIQKLDHDVAAWSREDYEARGAQVSEIEEQFKDNELVLARFMVLISFYMDSHADKFRIRLTSGFDGRIEAKTQGPNKVTVSGLNEEFAEALRKIAASRPAAAAPSTAKSAKPRSVGRWLLDHIAFTIGAVIATVIGAVIVSWLNLK